MLPKPKAIKAAANKKVTLLLAELRTSIPAPKRIKAGYITKFAPFLSIKRPVNGRDTKTEAVYTIKKKLAVSTKSNSIAYKFI